MDYTSSPQNVVHQGTGHRMHEDNQALPTVLTDADVNQVIWSLMEIIAQAGLPAQTFSPDTPASYQVLREALKRLYVQRAGDLALTGDFKTNGTWTGAFALNLANAYLNADAGNNTIIFNFDANDYMYYQRTINAWVIAIAGQTRLYVDQFGPGRNDDASTPNGLPRLAQVQSMVSGACTVITGVISHGGTLPLPAGYTQEQCHWMVSPRDYGTGGIDIQESGVQAGFTNLCYVDDTTRVVTSLFGFNTSGTGGKSCNYIVIGVK